MALIGDLLSHAPNLIRGELGGCWKRGAVLNRDVVYGGSDCLLAKLGFEIWIETVNKVKILMRGLEDKQIESEEGICDLFP